MDLIIRPEKVIDCTGKDPVSNVEVVLNGDTISAVRPVGSEPVDGNAETINAPGATLMPGLIDLHMHLFQWGQRHDIPWERESILEAGLRGVRNASTLLDMGVTTARDVASRDNLSIQLRDLINEGVVRGPRLLASGTQLEAQGRAAYFFRAIYVNGPDESRAAARRQLRAGADWIKIMATSGVGGGTGKLVGEPGWQELGQDEMAAAATEAHQAGRRITAHAIGNAGIKAAVRAGVDCIEHGDYLDDEAIELMLERNVGLVPTLLITRNLGASGRERGFEQNIIDRAQRTLDAGFESVRQAFAAGIRVATGSDVDLDETAAQEVAMLREAGIQPMDSLLAATKVAASIISLDDRIGTVEPGKIADLILMPGDPLADVSALEKVTHVFQGGKLVKRPAMGRGTSGEF
jgi:imidazolonepropionase-like amidohydrolase